MKTSMNAGKNPDLLIVEETSSGESLSVWQQFQKKSQETSFNLHLCKKRVHNERSRPRKVFHDNLI